MNFNIKDKKELLFITIISTILVIYYINFNANLGIYCSDVYVYLLNALYYSGTNIHSTRSIYLSPVVCYLTSLLFDLGYVDKVAIFIVTGILAIIGNIGLYLLLRLKFNNLLSLTGTIIYSTLALNLTWLANGSLDIPAASITIWIAYFTIIAIKDNPKYYTAVFPLLVIGFFTRYTVALVVPALALYYLYEKGILALYYLYEKGIKITKNDLKYIAIGLFFAIIICSVILWTTYSMGEGNLVFDKLIEGGVEGNLGSSNDNAYNPDFGYYLVNMGNFISSSNTTFMGKTPYLDNPTILAGFVFLILIVGGALWVKRTKFELNKSKICGTILCLIALLTFAQFSSTITIILTFIGLYLIGKDSEHKMGLTMLCWILVYLIFQSYYIVKVNRYIIPIFPALTYFIMVGVEEINAKITRKNIIPIILIVLFLIQGFAFTLTFEDTNEFSAPEEMSDYIKANIENNVSYYISNVKQKNLTNYTEIKQIDNLYLYKKNT